MPPYNYPPLVYPRDDLYPSNTLHPVDIYFRPVKVEGKIVNETPRGGNVRERVAQVRVHADGRLTNGVVEDDRRLTNGNIKSARRTGGINLNED